MPVFEYKAIAKSDGKNRKGVIDADNPTQARRKLREQGLLPTDLRETAAAGVEIGRASCRERV